MEAIDKINEILAGLRSLFPNTGKCTPINITFFAIIGFGKGQLEFRRETPGIVVGPHFQEFLAKVFRCHVVVHLETCYAFSLFICQKKKIVIQNIGKIIVEGYN